MAAASNSGNLEMLLNYCLSGRIY